MGKGIKIKNEVFLMKRARKKKKGNKKKRKKKNKGKAVLREFQVYSSGLWKCWERKKEETGIRRDWIGIIIGRRVLAWINTAQMLMSQ